MPELRVDAMIFDMDGVVIDSGDVYAKHWRRWGERHGLDFETQIAHVHPGRPPLETIRIVAPHLDAEAESLAFNAALDADDGDDAISAMPGAAALLASLPPERWTIATSAFRGVAIVWLEHCGLPVPPALVTVDDVEQGKPAPDPYLRAAQLLGVDPFAAWWWRTHPRACRRPSRPGPRCWRCGPRTGRRTWPLPITTPPASKPSARRSMTAASWSAGSRRRTDRSAGAARPPRAHLSAARRWRPARPSPSRPR